MKRDQLQKKINELENKLRILKEELNTVPDHPETVQVPKGIEDMFSNVESQIRKYFNDLVIDPESGEITAMGQRYVLLRTDSLSYEFLDFIKERYADRPEEEAVSIGNNFLYDNAKVFGKKDALAFHKRLELKDSIMKLTAGPIHFAFTGWANVEIFDESNPTPDEHYFLKFQHHNSFEAQSWIKAGKRSDIPVCTMNCGYSAGWCEESFGIPLTTVEISCEAKGDDACTFIMAPTDKIEEYVGKLVDLSSVRKFEIPVFFKRKNIEEQLRNSLDQKELLIQEIHHRVKNNLQVIISLLRLQKESISDQHVREEFESSINRVNTMAAVHELMYQHKDFDSLSLKTYINELTKSLVQMYILSPETKVQISIDIDDIRFNLEKSIPLGLILNEIVCNAFKHALRGKGTFYLKMMNEENNYTLIIGDTGKGIDEQKNEEGLGLALINILVEQIDAKIDVKNSEKGLEYRIDFTL